MKLHFFFLECDHNHFLPFVFARREVNILFNSIPTFAWSVWPCGLWCENEQTQSKAPWLEGKYVTELLPISVLWWFQITTAKHTLIQFWEATANVVSFFPLYLVCLDPTWYIHKGKNHSRKQCNFYSISYSVMRQGFPPVNYEGLLMIAMSLLAPSHCSHWGSWTAPVFFLLRGFFPFGIKLPALFFRPASMYVHSLL